MKHFGLSSTPSREQRSAPGAPSFGALVALCALCTGLGFACGSVERGDVSSSAGGESVGGASMGGTAGVEGGSAGIAGSMMSLGGSGGTAGSAVAGSGGTGIGGSEAMGGAGGSMPDEPPCDAVTEVFQVSCATGGGCHNAVGVGNFAVGQDEAENYIGATPTFNAVGDLCGLMIDPQNPERSMILTKVTLEPPYDEFDCGQPMPTNGSVTEEQVECLRSWLTQFQE